MLRSKLVSYNCNDVLPKTERVLYIAVEMTFMIYVIYSLYLEGQEYKAILSDDQIISRWTWSASDVERNDKEWSVWRNSLHWFVLSNIGHFCLSQACWFLRTNSKVRVVILTLYDLGAIVVYLGVCPVLIMLIHVLLMYATSSTNSKPAVWTVALMMIYFQTTYYILEQMHQMLNIRKYSEVNFAFFKASGFFYLHLISFAVDKISLKQSKCDEVESTVAPNDVDVIGSCESTKKYTTTTQQWHKFDDVRSPCFVDFLFYTLYLPTFVNGPVYTFRRFFEETKCCFSDPSYTHEVKDVFMNLLRLMLWHTLLDMMLSNLHLGTLSRVSIINMISYPSACALAYMQGQLFMVKYVCLYGVCGQLSRLDGVTPLPQPRCVSYVHSFSDMWKYFDVGMYQFIRLYIYQPLLGGRTGVWSKLSSAAVSFLFVYVWHNASLEIFVWVLGNYVSIVIETLAKELARSAVGVRLKARLSPTMQLRLRVLLTLPLYFFSVFNISFFFFGLDGGLAISKRLFITATWGQLLLFSLVVTAGLHNAVLISTLRQRRKSTSP